MLITNNEEEKLKHTLYALAIPLANMEDSYPVFSGLHKINH